MVFYFVCAVCAFVAFVIAAVIFIFTIKSRKPRKKAKVIASSIVFAIAVSICVIAFHFVFVPQVYFSSDTFYFNGHHYKETYTDLNVLPKSSTLVAYHIYNPDIRLGNRIIGYLTAECIYKTNNDEDKLYIPVEMSGVSCYTKVD